MHYHYYNGRTIAQIRNSLIRQGMKPEERHRLLGEIQAYRTKAKSEAARALSMRRTWLRYTKDLEGEIQRVRVALYYRENPRRNVVLLQYKELLDALMENFRVWATEGRRTPQEIAKKNGIPHDGAHWIDWVDHLYADEKSEILSNFDLVRTFGRKQFKPFLRERVVKPRKKKDSGVGIADHNPDAGQISVR